MKSLDVKKYVEKHLSVKLIVAIKYVIQAIAENVLYSQVKLPRDLAEKWN